MDRELIVNLWAIYDAPSGLVYGLSGRVYCVGGTDTEKLSILSKLSSSDYISAKRYDVPARFSVSEIGGTTRNGLAPLTAVKDPNAGLFEEMFKNLERDLPPTPDFSTEDSRAIYQKIPADPLCAITILYEDEGGNIRPIITDDDNAWFVEQERKRGRFIEGI
jgi:hypothetical protein